MNRKDNMDNRTIPWPVIDLHCDTISAIYERQQRLLENTGHFDLERAIKAGVKIQFMAMFLGPHESSLALDKLQRQMELYQLEAENNKNLLYTIRSKEDLYSHVDNAKIGSILHLEGAEALGRDMEVLYSLYASGLRSMGLTWNNGNLLAQGIGEGPEAGGLTSWGREVVGEMERMGIILDGAHISVQGFFDLLEIYNKPLMVTHANSRALCPHRRNLSDQQLLALGDNGGIIGVTQVSDFVKTNKAGVDDLIDHMVYIADLIGVQHLALGSDFDGADDIVMSGIEEYVSWPELLQRRGFTAAEVRMILYENAWKVMEQVLS